MRHFKKYIPVFTALLSILLLLGLQVNWLLYSYKIEEALFNKSVRIALNQTIAALSKDENMCLSMQKSISCDSSFRASRSKTPHVWKNLDSQIREELAQYDIDLAYELAIFKGNDTLKINHLDQLVGSSCYRLSLDNALAMTDTEIGVIFPNRYNFFLHHMGMMFLGSFILILIIGLSFMLVIRYYLKEIRLSKNVKELVNNLAHEFRTPISSISLAAKMILQSDEVLPNQKLRKYAETIIEENKRLLHQSDRILQLAAIEENNLEYHFEEVDLKEILDEAIRSVNFIVEQKGGKITIEYDDAPLKIHGDHNELVHVMINLLVNAYKYSHQKIEITVIIRKKEHCALVEIIDKGIGIAPKEKKKIFEKYYRISTGNKHNIKGFGIGLYYVNEVLKAHHAPIHVESEPGKGSRFSIVFPIKEGKHGT
jgi:two-component system phosphate regulon sensor histidine kinase PhoR